MRIVIWTDSEGYRRRSIVCNSDSDESAPAIGVPSGPPDLDQLDWLAVAVRFPELDIDEFKRRLHNRLVDTGLITWRDVQRSQNGITQALMATGRDRRLKNMLKRQLVLAYRIE